MEKIIIKNFGPIKEIDFCLDKQFNLVIGEQATGKSTLAKCIYFFKDVISEMTHLFMGQTEKLANMTADKILQLYYVNAKKLFYLSFGRYCHSEDTEISYQYADNRLAAISVVNGDIQFKYDQTTEQEIKHILMWYLEKTLSEKAADTSIFSLRALSVSLENLFGNNIRRMFIPACRSRVTGVLDQYQGQTLDIYFNALLENIRAFKFFLETSSEADVDVAYLHKDSVPKQLHERIADLKSLKQKILKGDYETDKEKTWIKLLNGTRVPVEYGSSGQQESLWILNFLTMIMYSASSRFLIIEEPEAHLYPSAQLELVKLIALVANTTGSEILITTHSPYILSAFNLLTYAGKVEKVNKEGLINPYQRIAPQKLGAFKLKSGICKDIYNEQEGLISAEKIDTVSEDINALFDKLIDKECDEMR